MKLKHLMYIFAASLMLFSVCVPATAAIAKEPTASTAANATPDGYPNSSNGGRGGGGGGSSAPGGFKGPAKPAPKPKPKSNKGKKSKKKNSKKKKKKKKKAKTQAQKYNEAKKKGKKVSGNNKKVTKTKDFPSKFKKYSSIDYYLNGKLNKRRYYGKNGKAQLDIHYSDHGNPKKHPKVPHRHDWHKNKKGDWAPKKEWY